MELYAGNSLETALMTAEIVEESDIFIVFVKLYGAKLLPNQTLL